MRLALPISALALAAALAAGGGVGAAPEPTASPAGALRVKAIGTTSFDALRPGQAASTEVELTATDVVRRVTVTASAAASPFAQRLRLRIAEPDRAPAFDGPLTALRTVSLPQLRAGERRRYRVTATFPDGGDDNALQGRQVALRLRWAGDVAAAAASGSSTGRAPQLRVLRPRVASRRIRVRVRCWAACAATVSVTRRRRVVGSRTLRLERGGRAVVLIPAPRRTRGRRVRRVSVRAVVRDRAGRTRRATRALRVRYRDAGLR